MTARHALAALSVLATLLAACADGDTGGAWTAARALAGGRRVKRVVSAEEAPAARAALEARGGLVDAFDYGSFELLIAAEGAVDEAMPGEARDDLDLIPLGAYQLDAAAPEATLEKLPADLRLAKLSRPLGDRERGLYLVQFVGPVMDAWLDELAEIGVEVIGYQPEDAYVVRAKGRAAGLLHALAARRHVQLVAGWEPAFRLTPELIEARHAEAVLPLTVQVAAGGDAKETLAALERLAARVVSTWASGPYLDVQLDAPAELLADIAALDDVVHVELRRERRRLDEVQGVILAGNLSAGQPTGPGYLSWLAAKGFTSAQFGGFAVNLVDDAYDLDGHPDLPASRIAFENNPTAQGGAQGGHGFLNAHIVGGYNDLTGAAYEDASGYNYGLGVAPFARVGLTAVFGSGSSTPTQWEATAYGQGARVSSNSWGYFGARAYDVNAQEYDRIVRDAQSAAGNQQLIVIFAAGNDGSSASTVSSPGTAKNVITVGASESVRQSGTDGCAVANTGANSAEDIISFSSRGPVNSTGGDGRVKPDLVAPGTHIQAAIPQSSYDGSSVCNKYWPSGQTLYGWSSGTSHATPAVAGGAALVYQDFANHGRPAPSPAMVKAYLMSSATRMTGVGANDTLPSNNQGMGRMDLGRAFDGVARTLIDQTEILGATGATYRMTGTAAGALRVTLAWTDAPGATTGGPWVNNLDLEVTIGGTTYKGNVFSGGASIAGGSADTKNNVESVFVPSGVTGAFTVTVRAANIAGDGVPGNADTTDQDFALVIHGATAVDASAALNVAPGSLSFGAVQGGPNPPAQALSVTNSGSSAAIAWTAASNASWLSISASSDSTPSNPSAAVSVAGLAAGTYNGAITFTAPGVAGSPFTVPVTLTVAPDELLENGGLEVEQAPWIFSGTASKWLVSGPNPHTGTGYARLGGTTNTAGQFYQDVIIPAGTSPSLRFWLDIKSNEDPARGFDKLFVEVRTLSGALLSTLAIYTDFDETNGIYLQRGPFSLGAYAGQTVRLQFRHVNDATLMTNYRIDDVSVR